MKSLQLAAVFFLIAGIAWLAVAALRPEYRLVFGALGVLNLVLAAVYLRKRRETPSK